MQMERSGFLLSQQYRFAGLSKPRLIPTTIRSYLATESARQLENSHDVPRRERGGLHLPRYCSPSEVQVIGRASSGGTVRMCPGNRSSSRRKAAGTRQDSNPCRCRKLFLYFVHIVFACVRAEILLLGTSTESTTKVAGSEKSVAGAMSPARGLPCGIHLDNPKDVRTAHSKNLL